ncbi:MAG: hypothetical protein ACTHKK_02840, partial [Candidatus Nitrosocosmicus sp.]
KTGNNNKNSKDKGFLPQKDEKVPSISDKIIKKTKDKNTDKPKHVHKSINQKNKDTDSNNPADTNLNDFSKPSAPESSFDLPFTAIAPNNLF